MKKEGFFNGFPARLREIRKSLGLTQDAFCEKLGVSKSTYVRYELGEMMPKLQFLSVLTRKFRVNSNWLLTGLGEMFLGTSPEDISLINPKVLKDERYYELLKLLNIQAVEDIIMAKIIEIKALLSPMINEYLSREGHLMDQAS